MKYKNEKLDSYYSPFFSFDYKTKKFIDENFFNDKIKDFFQARNILLYTELNDKYIFSNILFNNIHFSSLYKEFFYDIEKDNTIKYKVKYSITFNKNLTELYCKNSNVFFSEINIYNKPIYYLIYIESMEEITKKLEQFSINSIINKSN